MDGPDDRKRAELISERLRHWKSGTIHVGAVSPRKTDRLHDEATGKGLPEVSKEH